MRLDYTVYVPFVITWLLVARYNVASFSPLFVREYSL